MENKCFSCEILVPKDENANKITNTKELVIYCVPEMVTSTDFEFPIMSFCAKCVELLEGYGRFKRKCLDWQKHLQTLDDTQHFCEVEMKEECREPHEPPSESDNENEIVDHEEDACAAQANEDVVSIRHKCPECAITLKTKKQLKRHLKIVHIAEKLFACAICNAKFKAKVSLQSHARTHDNLRPYICQFCGKSYKTPANLSLHEVTHANRRDYKCPTAECSKAFNTRSELLKHKLIAHTPRTEWKYQCEFCERKFPQKCTLDRHVKTHTNDRSFQCHLCEYKSFSNTELRKHLGKHDDMREFKCFLCSAEYKRKTTLEVHLLQKHQIGVGVNDVDLPIKLTEKNFVCAHCDKRYTDNIRLRNHVNTTHPGLESLIN